MVTKEPRETVAAELPEGGASRVQTAAGEPLKGKLVQTAAAEPREVTATVPLKDDEPPETDELQRDTVATEPLKGDGQTRTAAF